VALRRETGIRVFPRHAVMDRKMSKAEIYASVPSIDALSTWFSLLVKLPSPLMFAIVLGGEN